MSRPESHDPSLADVFLVYSELLRLGQWVSGKLSLHNGRQSVAAKLQQRRMAVFR